MIVINNPWKYEETFDYQEFLKKFYEFKNKKNKNGGNELKYLVGRI